MSGVFTIALSISLLLLAVSSTSNAMNGNAIGGCFFEGDLTLAGLGSRSVSVIEDIPTARACHRRCRRTPGCGWMSYFVDTLICKLRWREISTFNPTGPNNETVISAPRSCVGCFVTGQGYAADNCIEAIPDVACASNCQLLCALHTECVSFTYYPGRSSCQLNAKDTPRTTDPDAISGPKYCPTCDCTIDD